MKLKKKRRKLGATSKSFEKSRERKHQKTSGKGKKMKKSTQEIVRRTRGRGIGFFEGGYGMKEFQKSTLKLVFLVEGLLKRITKLGLILMMGVSMNADAGLFGLGGTSWKEEVLLHDGSRIIVTRSGLRLGRNILAFRPIVIGLGCA